MDSYSDGPAERITRFCSELRTRIATFYLLLNPLDVNFVDQYKVLHMQRELVKAYCGFNIPANVLCDNNLRYINTGNWGVGSSGGDVELKFALQWIAATVASGRRLSIRYYPEKDEKASRTLPGLIELNNKNRMNVLKGWYMLLLMAAEEPKKALLPRWLCKKSW
eukprot:TRINITY_DN4612_c0_g1_i1.p1 TRINITY_DN4612_c0_g1~~TRINITY_DN4612_c0_g1_i1.p1  ORF type:complete len:165 (-),score=13.45 TRINITY_DN4612_c0_g1_i1:250-744(-)